MHSPHYPFVKVGGFFLAMKGPKAEEEVAAAQKGIALLGGRVKEIMPVKQEFTPADDGEDGEELSSFSAIDRYIVVVEKIRPTPLGYPRSFAKIKSKPL